MDEFVRAHAARMEMNFSQALADLIRPVFLKESDREAHDTEDRQERRNKGVA